MKKRMFTITSVAALSAIAIVFIFSQGVFFTPGNAIGTYTAYEKHLKKLFVQYGEQSDTMTDKERSAWQNEVDQVSTKAAKALIKIQKDPQDWKDYLASTGQPDRPSPFAELEFTGLAAKELDEITSDQFDEWYAARHKQQDDHSRAEMRADGIWDDQTIEEIISDVNEKRENDPRRQEHREKMRELVIWYEGREDRERERAKEKREEAAYQAQRAKDKAWLAAEKARLAQGFDDESLLSETPETPSEQIEQTHTPSDDVLFPSSVDDVPVIPPPSEKPIPTEQEPQLPQDIPFNPDAFALTLSEDMALWDDRLQEKYQDVFLLELDASFGQALPEEARQYFQERKLRLQYEYVKRLDDVLRDTPRENRANILRIVRETLSETWDSNFTDAVIRQLQPDGK